MEKMMLWGLIVLGVILLIIGLSRLPLKDGLIIFLVTSYISVIAGTIVVEKKMLIYPVKLLDKQYFHSSLLFEMLLLPMICIYFYLTTHHSKAIFIAIQAVIYSAIVTGIEVSLETFTTLIHYRTWTWVYTFVSIFLLLLFVRGVTGIINLKTRR